MPRSLTPVLDYACAWADACAWACACACALGLLWPSMAAATPTDISQVRPGGQICWQVPRGPDEWYAGPPYRIVCRMVSRPAGLPSPARR